MSSPFETPAKGSSSEPSSTPRTLSSIGPSVSQRGTASRTRPPLVAKWSSSAASRSSASAETKFARDRSFSIESRATTRPSLRVSSSTYRRTSLGLEKGQGTPLQLAGRSSDVDLLQLKPDETEENGGVDGLFVHFAVKEIRQVEERARDSAEAKREELRLMVGERYRDLLSAADSIVRMRTSATSLLGRLEVAQQDCTQEELKERARVGRRTTKPSAGSSRTPYTTATLIKLLLDSPEHVWRAIERNDFLAAARLEAVARAVYRALAGAVEREGDTDEGDELTSSFPLIEQQWETILQLGPQIVARARAALQLHDVGDQEAVETLAAIIMVENVPVLDALDLFLEMRTRALQSILGVSGAPTPGFSPGHARQMSVSSGIEASLRQTIELVLKTVQHVKAALVPTEGTPMLLDLLEGLQISPVLPAGGTEAGSPFRAAEVSAASGAMPSVLETLPNAHTLLRYLPASILTFTPFIDTSVPAEAAQPSQRLADWLASTLHLLSKELEQTLLGIVSATRMVQLRDGLLQIWQTQPASREAQALRQVVSGALEARFTQTYQEQLARLVSRLPVELQAALAALRSAVEDIDSSAFVYSNSLPFPSLSVASAHATNTGHAFQAFEDAITKRLQGRTPLIDAMLLELEAGAEALQTDLRGWLERSTDPSSLAVYRSAAKSALDNIVECLRQIQTSHATQVSQSVFVGSFARCLARSSVFAARLLIQDIEPDSAIYLLASFTAALDTIQTSSLAPWHEEACSSALALIETSLKSLADGSQGYDGSSFEAPRPEANGHTAGRPSKLPTQPSSALSSALYTLVCAVGPSRAGSQAALDLLHAFLERLGPVVEAEMDAVVARQPAVASQLHFDIAFLQALAGETDALDSMEASLRKKDKSVSANSTAITQSAEAALRRQQTLLSPLMETSHAFLPLGPSSVSSEFRTPVGVSTPHGRFGLLPVPTVLANGSL